MKIVCYDTAIGPRCGVLQGEALLDASRLLSHPGGLRDAQALLATGPDALDRLQRALGAKEGQPVTGAQLLSPVLQPPTIRDYSVFEDHASMGGQWQLSEAWYRLPTFYFSNPLCVYGTDATIPFPSATRKFDLEVELAVVIGKEGRSVRPEDAMDHVAGFMIFVDWSSRDLQRDEMQLHLGPAKGKDSANSFGPWLVTRDEVAHLFRDGQLHARATMSVNGQEWLSGTTGGMQHDWPALIERASRDSRIVPGDVIGSGCVAGASVPEAVRMGRPARYLEPGDRIEVTLEGLGTLVTTLGAPKLPRAGYRFLPPSRQST
ncbi:MAG: fumarylacetoacetate hydrolase family protein [Pigmentiphaga sp.]